MVHGADVMPRFSFKAYDDSEVPSQHEWDLLDRIRQMSFFSPSSLGKPDLDAYENLRRRKIIAGDPYFLVNPASLAKSNQLDLGLHFLLVSIRGNRNAFTQLVNWIARRADDYHMAAFATNGPFDFVIRFIGTDDDLESFRKDLARELPGQEPSEIPVHRVGDCFKYAYRLDIPPWNKNTTFSPSELERIEEMQNRAREEDTSFAFEIQQKHILLGHQHLLNSPATGSIFAIILLADVKVDEVEQLVRQELTGRVIRDAFAFQNSYVMPKARFDYLLFCDFPSFVRGLDKPYHAYYSSYAWFQEAYRLAPGMTTLTSWVYHVVLERQDVFGGLQVNHIRQLRLSYPGGVSLGFDVYRGRRLPDVQPRLSKESFRYHGLFLGGSGCGKTQGTAANIMNGLLAEGANVFYLDFKQCTARPRAMAQGSEKNDCTAIRDSLGRGSLYTQAELLGQQSTLDTLLNAERPDLVLVTVKKDPEALLRQLHEKITELGNVSPPGPMVRHVLFLDELLNVTKGIDQPLHGLLDDTIVPLLKTAGSKGVGVCLIHQDMLSMADKLGDVGKTILGSTHLKFMHSLDIPEDRAHAKELVRAYQGKFPKSEAYGIQFDKVDLPPGRCVALLTSPTRDPLPPLVVESPKPAIRK